MPLPNGLFSDKPGMVSFWNYSTADFIAWPAQSETFPEFGQWKQSSRGRVSKARVLECIRFG